MKRIQLTKGLEAIVDDEDFDYVSKWRWHVLSNRRTGRVYASRKGRICDGEKRTDILMHRDWWATGKYAPGDPTTWALRRGHPLREDMDLAELHIHHLVDYECDGAEALDLAPLFKPDVYERIRHATWERLRQAQLLLAFGVPG